jgi:glutathione S-transferase
VSASPVIRLYTQSINPFSEKVAAALRLKGLPFERVISDDPEDLIRWSPIARTLPVLEVDGRRKVDSIQIVAWLDELQPEPPLFSPDPRTAENQRRLASWSDDSFLWYWNRWRASRYPQPGDEGPVDDSLLSRLRRKLGRRLAGPPASRAAARELEVIAEIELRLDDLVGFLGSRPFFYSDEPSVADLAVYAMLRVLRDGPVPRTPAAIAARPSLVGFLERIEARIGSMPQQERVAPS